MLSGRSSCWRPSVTIVRSTGASATGWESGDEASKSEALFSPATLEKATDSTRMEGWTGSPTERRSTTMRPWLTVPPKASVLLPSPSR